MSLTLEQELKSIIDFDTITQLHTIQSLWSGYGTLYRAIITGYQSNSIIVKRISPPSKVAHPRGWNTDVSHQRKLKSYEVEARWYQEYTNRTSETCRTPALLGYREYDSHSLLVLEDLNTVGFSLRKSTLNHQEIKRCLSWLASFHARFLDENPNGLWPIGSYWQLETRQSEWETMADGELKKQARAIHNKLCNATFKTFVHGDAKYANFCFAPNGDVAAVDFQYVGGGCGIKDVAYLLSCVDDENELENNEEAFLDHYFNELKVCIEESKVEVNNKALEKEWRLLYPFAWADFERFLQGWAPGHWKSSGYSKKQVDKVLKPDNYRF